jgi:hypothetical protein
MSQDIRRMSREDLDELNHQIAIYKAGRAEPAQGLLLNHDLALEQEADVLCASAVRGVSTSQKDFLPDAGKKIKAEQLDLWGGGGDFTRWASVSSDRALK